MPQQDGKQTMDLPLALAREVVDDGCGGHRFASPRGSLNQLERRLKRLPDSIYLL